MYVMSHVLDAGVWTYVKESKAAQRNMRITETVDRYAIVQVRAICHAPCSADFLIVDKVERAEALGTLLAYRRNHSGNTMPLTTSYVSTQATAHALRQGSESSPTSKRTKTKPSLCLMAGLREAIFAYVPDDVA